MSSTTVHDPAWTDEDSAYALAWHDRKKGLCSGPCGLPLSQTLDPANRGRFDVTAESVCDGCAAIAEHTQIEYLDQDRKVPPGLRYAVTLQPQEGDVPHG